MKLRVNNPQEAAAKTGGCTFETDIGWWTYTNQEDKNLGKPFAGERYALYIPTLQKTGEPVNRALVAHFKNCAQKLGLSQINGASGMWVLSETGEVQIEYVWICWSREISEAGRAMMPDLAEEIRATTNQDCVAYEEPDGLKFTA